MKIGFDLLRPFCKSEWDEDAPWIYGEKEETYGEVVSLGPNTAPIIHEKLVKLIEESKK